VRTTREKFNKKLSNQQARFSLSPNQRKYSRRITNSTVLKETDHKEISHKETDHKETEHKDPKINSSRSPSNLVDSDKINVYSRKLYHDNGSFNCRNFAHILYLFNKS
jgi:hypothetical protein